MQTARRDMTFKLNIGMSAFSGCMGINVTLTLTMIYDAGKESGKPRKRAENEQFSARALVLKSWQG